MATSVPKPKHSVTRPSQVHATALPPPYQLAIEDVPFRLTTLESGGAREVDCEQALVPATWFSVAPTAPVTKRFLYLVQQETDTGLIVLIMLYDRSATDEASGLRLPPSGAWLRAVVDGIVHVMASDLVLSRKSITAWIGGDEPPTTPAMPPYT